MFHMPQQIEDTGHFNSQNFNSRVEEEKKFDKPTMVDQQSILT